MEGFKEMIKPPIIEYLKFTIVTKYFIQNRLRLVETADTI